MYNEALELQRELGGKRSVAMLLSNLGLLALAQNEHRRAGPLFRESLRLKIELGLKVDMPDSLAGLAGVALADGQPRRGALIMGAVDALCDAMGYALEPSGRATYDGVLEGIKGQLSDADFRQAWEEGHKMPSAEVIEYALQDPTEQE